MRTTEVMVDFAALAAIGYLIGLVIGLVILYYIAKQFYAVAVDKGHPERKYFHICFWLGLVGYLLVIALPDRNRAQVQNVVVTTPEPVYVAAEEDREEFVFTDSSTAYFVGESNLKCGNCKRVQFRGNKKCQFCGTVFKDFQSSNQ